jgi:O-antigen ligase
VAFPVLQPQLPGHIAPEDLLIGAAILGVLLWAGTQRIPIHVPYAVPMSILIVSGLIAALFGILPGAGVLAASQEVYLLAWAAALMTFARTPANVSLVLGVWTWGAVGWSTLLTVAIATHQWWLVGASSADGARAQLWFDNPNMAGNYFLISFFIVLIGRHPRRPVPRVAACLIILTALALSGSNAALLSLALGLAATGLLAVWRRVDLLHALAAAALAIVLLAFVAVYVLDSNLTEEVTQSSNVLVSRSVARGPKSVEGRSTLFAAGVQLYRTGSLLGRGPATTRTTLDLGLATSKVKEAHNDYLATLVERGPIGEIGLVILVVGIGIRAFAVARRPLRPPFARVLTSPSAIFGVVVIMAFTAITHEILHYRHAWAFLGLLAALHYHGLAGTALEDRERT